MLPGMEMSATRGILTVTVTVVAVGLVVVQCRKPRWLVGRLFVWLMNRSHSGLTTWGLSHVSIGKGDTILDVGCGGGKTIDRLAAVATEGRVYGIDHSEESVAAARRTNRELITAGRVDIRSGSVSQMPFPDRTFNLITAVETHYYWPEPAADLREVLRVLKPGGTLVLIAEVYRTPRLGWLNQLIMKLLGGSCMTVREHAEMLESAGYARIEMFEESKGWLCAVARKASHGGFQ
jgi:ubiquinone/menaquinone biosynthesis C-methylase UbiE